ncbi:unnamed protein product [Pseudo-nitzschia multistriata]|uniref:Uncharacterized protein n=1 Tax=Pseudo-nitzschia multistriata TaxID=183589 RepID=A0A448ZGB6_9STRA|nr:unnamed protein product [Pseudo-nitzschia multistriata]
MLMTNSLAQTASDEGCATRPREDLLDSKKIRDFPGRQVSSIKHNIRKPTVTFSSKNDVFEIPRPTNEEKKYMHMSSEDQRKTIVEIADALRRLESYERKQNEASYYADETQHDDKMIEELGLERIVEQQRSDRLDRVKSAIFVILQRQRQSKILQSSKKLNIDEQWLKEHYRPFSELAAKLARSRGLRDEEMAPSLFPRLIVMAR